MTELDEKKGKRASKRRKARTADERDSQMIRLAIDCVEERMRNGTASSQEYVHYLRLAQSRERDAIEREKLSLERDLVRAKTDAVKATTENSALYSRVIRALGVYRGEEPEEEDEYED